MKIIKLLFFLTLFCNIIEAQTGFVTGSISDEITGEGIPFANVYIAETKGGFTSDLDGTYSFELPSGNYQFEVSYIGYNSVLKNVEIIEGETIVVNIIIREAEQDLDEVLVTAKQLRNTENSLQTIQRLSLIHI